MADGRLRRLLGRPVDRQGDGTNARGGETRPSRIRTVWRALVPLPGALRGPPVAHEPFRLATEQEEFGVVPDDPLVPESILQWMIAS